MRLKFTVPGRPQGKGRPRFSRKTGRAFTPDATVRYENLIAHVASVAMAGRSLMEGPLRLAMVAYIAVPASWANKRRTAALCGLEVPTKKPDNDNVAKMMDALNGVVFADDKQIVDLSVRKFYAGTPRLEISINHYFSA